MLVSSLASPENLLYIEQMRAMYLKDPESVDERWRAFFDGFALGQAGGGEDTSHTAVVRMAFLYRTNGHLQAHINPLDQKPGDHPQLAISELGLTNEHLDRVYDCSAFHGMGQATLRELINALKETYCGTVGVEFLHINDNNARHWLKDRVEQRRMRPNLTRDQKINTLKTLLQAQYFEEFLHIRFKGSKRFSLEGGETLMTILDKLVHQGTEVGVKEYVIGMAHRGRLNVLANILKKPFQTIFAEFEDHFQPDTADGDGDVKYHLGFSADVETANGKKLHVSLTPNPSHLEAVNPVVEGRVRAKQQAFNDHERKMGVPVLIHGDAAVAGQGVVVETLNLAHLEGYATGGTIHVIVNNQIGFTTNPEDGRSTTYCTDVFKTLQAPIFHINGDDPEAAVFVTELALEYRQKFGKDVVIDMYCYRKYGHNESDEPSFTQPLMYQKIEAHKSPMEVYAQHLIDSGELTADELAAIKTEFQTNLDKAQEEMKNSTPGKRGMKSFSGVWERLHRSYDFKPVDTGVDREKLLEVGRHFTSVPEGFTPHRKILELMERRRNAIESGKGLDWGIGEALAYGTLVNEGTPVRLSGQDCRRGTFSHRHAAIVDSINGRRHVIFSGLEKKGSYFHVYDSPLSEEAVMGFDYGYSLDAPHALTLWEAQFGDFVNGAQNIIDQFLVSSESKWQRSSGLVLLLPHGYEGNGPEHSSARLERFLQSCAEDNIQVANITTPAQFFHALRRQVKRTFRKPLIVMTPKSLLRLPAAQSTLEEFTTGSFAEVLDDTTVNPQSVRRVVLCSGKVYYDLLAKRKPDVALLRMEQFYPFPDKLLTSILERYGKTKEFVWVQEESQNMGGWTFVDSRLRALGYNFHYIGRDASASPAVGSHKVHEKEQKELIEHALNGGPVPYLVRSFPLRPGETSSVA